MMAIIMYYFVWKSWNGWWTDIMILRPTKRQKLNWLTWLTNSHLNNPALCPGGFSSNWSWDWWSIWLHQHYEVRISIYKAALSVTHLFEAELLLDYFYIHDHWFGQTLSIPICTILNMFHTSLIPKKLGCCLNCEYKQIANNNENT